MFRIQELENALQDEKDRTNRLSQEMSTMYQLSKENIDSSTKEINRLSALKENIEKDLTYFRELYSKANKALLVKNPVRGNTIAFKRLQEERDLIEEQLKAQIKDLTELLEIVREKLNSLERYVIFVENRYVDIGGNPRILIRPFIFAENEERIPS